MSTPNCECTEYCGSDPRLARGLVTACATRREERHRVAHERQLQQLEHGGAPPAALSSALQCACFEGTCRGGQVVDGRLANGLLCKEAQA